MTPTPQPDDTATPRQLNTRPFALPGAPARRPLEADDQLIVDGRILRSRRGAAVTLEGTNTGGWFVHEGWLSPAGRPSLDPDSWGFSASSSAPGRSPRDAVGGTQDTAWTPEPSDPGSAWLQVDLGGPDTIDGVSLGLAGDAPRVILRGSSDGASWRELGEAAPGDKGDGRAQIDFDFTEVSHLRLDVSAAAGGAVGVHGLLVHVTDEFNVRATLERRFGEADAADVIDAYQDAWFGADDLDAIADLGLNLVRVPLYWQLLMHPDGTPRPDDIAFRKIDWVVHEASRRGLYTILGLHGAPGGASPWHWSGQAGTNRLWTEPELQDWTVAFWRRIAERYRDTPGIAGYDLINEPVVGEGGPETPAQLREKYELVDRLYRTVRDADPARIAFIPAFPDLAAVPDPDTFGWTNVVYETHHFAFAQQGDREACVAFAAAAIDQLVAYQARHDLPMFAGEFWFGEFVDQFRVFTDALAAHGISWATWTWKTKNGLDGRDAAGKVHGRHWGLFGDAPDAMPDLNADDPDVIARKWGNYATAGLNPDHELAENLRRS